MKKIFSMVVIILILASNITFSAPQKTNSSKSKVTEAEENTLTIFHTSDLNGQLSGKETNDVIDFSYIGGLKKSMPNSILVDAGNSLSGSLTLEPSKGEKMIDLMNLAEYDIIGIGNRDFSYTSERILELSGVAKFEMLSSNITKRGKELVGLTAIKEVGELKIGFFSVISESTKAASKRENINELMFQEIHSTARSCVSALKSEGAVIIVALTSLGEKSATDIATLVDGINLIIDSSNDEPIMSNRNVGKLIKKTLLVGTGRNAVNVGRVDIFLDEEMKVSHYKAQLFTNEDMETLQPNKEIAEIVDELASEADKIYNEEVTTSSVFLKKETDMQVKSTPLGNFIADIYRDTTKADIAIVSAGEIYSGIEKGKITRADINSLVNTSTNIQTKKISPKVLRLVLEGAVSKSTLTESTGVFDSENSATTKFLQISGFKFHYNPKNDVGHKIVKIILDSGKELNLNDASLNLRIAASSFLMNGGEEYTALANLGSVFQQFDDTGTIIVNYLMSGNKITENTDERIILSDKKEDLTQIWILSCLAVLGLIILIMLTSSLISKIR